MDRQCPLPPRAGTSRDPFPILFFRNYFHAPCVFQAKIGVSGKVSCLLCRLCRFRVTFHVVRPRPDVPAQACTEAARPRFGPEGRRKSPPQQEESRKIEPCPLDGPALLVGKMFTRDRLGARERKISPAGEGYPSAQRSVRLCKPLHNLSYTSRKESRATQTRCSTCSASRKE